MTPLLGTKTPSVPVGDKSGGERRAARAAAFQVFTKHETRDTAIAWRVAQASANSEVFTKHESRDTNHGIFVAQSRLPCSRLFTIVHHCSRLFGIVQQKNITPEPVSPLRPHRQRGLYGSSRDTSHETRVSPSLRRLQGEQPQTRPTGFHESRDTKHESRLLCFSPRHESRNTVFPFPCGGSKESSPKLDQQVFTKHETRNTNHGFYAFHRDTSHETRVSPSLRRLQGEQPQARPTGFHESRNTNHESRHLCFSRITAFVVARHGAAMARHGRHIAPEPVSRTVRRLSRRGKRQMTPCRERGMFWIAQTRQLSI